MNLKFDLVRLANEDVIATSGICKYNNADYIHYVVGPQSGNNIKVKMILDNNGNLEYMEFDNTLSEAAVVLGETPKTGDVFHVYDDPDDPVVHKCNANHDYLDNANPH